MNGDIIQIFVDCSILEIQGPNFFLNILQMEGYEGKCLRQYC